MGMSSQLHAYQMSSKSAIRSYKSTSAGIARSDLSGVHKLYNLLIIFHNPTPVSWRILDLEVSLSPGAWYRLSPVDALSLPSMISSDSVHNCCEPHRFAFLFRSTGVYVSGITSKAMPCMNSQIIRTWYIHRHPAYFRDMNLEKGERYY